jgi:CRP/FNR family cyclic AMP-dependent transcriptional regulator
VAASLRLGYTRGEKNNSAPRPPLPNPLGNGTEQNETDLRCRVCDVEYNPHGQLLIPNHVEVVQGPCISKSLSGLFQMTMIQRAEFTASTFLAQPGIGRRVVQIKAKHVLFSQGGPSDCVFYLQTGRAKLTVVSKNGKEATITLLASGDFVGEEAIADTPGLRVATATAITACSALRIERDEMSRVLHTEQSFCDLFLKFLLARSMRTQADLIDQLFNSSEKRLARILLLMADFGNPGEPETLIPPITQETLAEMIGTTRSRVSYFMNRFRKLGFIEYNGRIHVNKSLLNIVLHDQLPEDNALRPDVLPPSETGPVTPARSRRLSKTAWKYS